MPNQTTLSRVDQLPPGQKWREDLPRFGLTRFATRFPSNWVDPTFQVWGDVGEPITIKDALTQLSFVEQTADFHCVTTWSCAEQQWGGYRFIDVLNKLVKPKAKPQENVQWVVFYGQDGYRSAMALEDLCTDDVLLATHHNGQKLTIEHGAPLRLIAPQHYGYKSVKHVRGIKLLADSRDHKPTGLSFMAHPRARVAREERARGAPGWVFRYLYRPLVMRTELRFSRAMQDYYREHNEQKS